MGEVEAVGNERPYNASYQLVSPFDSARSDSAAEGEEVAREVAESLHLESALPVNWGYLTYTAPFLSYHLDST